MNRDDASRRSAVPPVGIGDTSVAALRAVLDSIRALTGDDAYERYLQRHRTRHPDVPALSPAAFYASEIERRYSGITRCC